MPLAPEDAEQIVGRIIAREGGFVFRAEDRGGPTKYGVTQATLSSWIGREATVDEVKELTEATARAIYRQRYIAAPGFDRLDLPLAELVVDIGVNHGTRRAIEWLRRAAGVPEGPKGEVVVPPQVVSALAYSDARRVYLSLVAQRIRFYGELITRDARQAVFARGWLNRATEFLLRAP